MSHTALCRLLPNFEIIAEAFPGCSSWIPDPQRSYQTLKLFHNQEILDEQAVYLLKKEDADRFPRNQYSYICTETISGNANHICCPHWKEEDILVCVLNLFAALREQEIQLDQLVYQDASLKELCEVGSKMLGNPVYLHDDWFIALAMSTQVDEMMEPEYVMSSTSGFVPQAIIDDFKYDNEYLETYSHHSPQIWQSTANDPRSLYVNLWEGSIYRGRLLVLERNHPIQKRDFLLAELIAQHATRLLRKRNPGTNQNRSMDDFIHQLLQGKPIDPVDLNQILRSLNWNSTDQFCVIRVQSQQGFSSAMDHFLHSDLFRSFPKCYILLNSYQQCLILNLTSQRTTLPVIRHTLSPLCRDYCLYAGISSPVTTIQNLHLAYSQSGIALDEAFRLRNQRWIIPFSDCALDYWFEHLSGELKIQDLISPEISYLMQYDKENGTEYFITLQEYLLQERNIPRTSEKLIIHRTTLLYRLKKIQSLVSLDLDDPKNRLYLLMSLHVLKNSR